MLTGVTQHYSFSSFPLLKRPACSRGQEIHYCVQLKKMGQRDKCVGCRQANMYTFVLISFLVNIIFWLPLILRYISLDTLSITYLVQQT